MRIALASLALAAMTLPALAQDISQILRDRIERDHQGVAIVVAVVENGTPSFTSFGPLAADGAAVDEHTLFEIGSLSKIFTNLLLAQMVIEGKIDLNAPVADYLPEGRKLPDFEGQTMTILDLATHSSGLPPVPPELAFADPANPYQHYSAELLDTFLSTYALPYAPGETYQYSNTGIVLLGEVLSQVTGESYENLVQTRILDPLGMEDTMLVVPEDKSARFATGHDAQGQPVDHWDFDAFASAGGWRSTAADMAKFIAAASGQVETDLKPAFDRMLEETRPADSPNMTIGLGWMVLVRPEGGSTIWHNGITGGFNAFAGYDRDTHRAAVVLANAVTETGVEDIGFHLIDPAAPLTPQPQQHTEIEVDPALLDNYVGTYELGPEFQITVTAEHGRLFVQPSGQDKLEASAESETRFLLDGGDAEVSFETGADGRAIHIVLHQNGQDIEGKRK